MAVFDRPRTIAQKWRKDGTVVDWNPVFRDAVFEVGVELCWPHSPEQKGSAENLVKWVKGSFFKQRRFHDDADLQQQLREWHVEVNDLRPTRATGVIPAHRLADERPRPRALKVTPDTLAIRVPAWVSPTGTVVHDAHSYVMPPEACGQPATLYLYRDRVRIVAGRHAVEYERRCGPAEPSTMPELRAARLAHVHGTRGKRYLKRQDFLDTGPAAAANLTEVVHRRPRAWYQEVDDLHDLLQAVGPDVLRAALTRAVREQIFGAEYVGHFVREAVVTPRQEELPV